MTTPGNKLTLGCGYSVSNPADRIVGGQEVSPKHSLPYQVYVQVCVIFFLFFWINSQTDSPDIYVFLKMCKFV